MQFRKVRDARKKGEVQEREREVTEVDNVKRHG